jgi:hypothetical protein
MMVFGLPDPSVEMSNRKCTTWFQCEIKLTKAVLRADFFDDLDSDRLPLAAHVLSSKVPFIRSQNYSEGRLPFS